MCENRQRQSCKAFTGLYNRAKTVGSLRSLLPEILAENDPPLQNADFESIFARSASAATLSEKVQLIRIGSLTRAFQ